MNRKTVVKTAVFISATLLFTLTIGCSKVNIKILNNNSKPTDSVNGTKAESNMIKQESSVNDKAPNNSQDSSVQTGNQGPGSQNSTSTSPQSKPAAASADKNQPQVPVPVPTPAPAVKPSQKTSASPINEVKAKPVSVQTSASQAVAVSSSDSFYNLVISDLSQGKELVVSLGGVIQSSTVVDKAMKIVEDAGYSGYISGIEYNIDNNTAFIRFIYKDSRDLFLSKISAVSSKVKEVVNSVVKPGMTDFEKEIALHDYVVNHTKYDYKSLTNSSIPDDSYTAYGVLLKGTAVCEGYAEAMYRLLNAAGVKCLIISGKGNNIPHAWNLVNIGGSYYHLDSTFDDPVSSSGNVLSYNYFNITDSQVSKDHSWNSADYPKCSATSANYFIMNKLYANNKTEYYNIIKSGLLNKLSIIRCKTSSYNTDIYTPYILSDVLKDNPSINYLNLTSGFTYNYDQNSSVMELYITYK